VLQEALVISQNTTVAAILRHKKLQPYKTERHRSMKWYPELSKKLLNILIHNAFVLYTERKQTIDHLNFRCKVINVLSEAHTETFEPHPEEY
jgi:hypothetical protein